MNAPPKRSPPSSATPRARFACCATTSAATPSPRSLTPARGPRASRRSPPRAPPSSSCANAIIRCTREALKEQDTPLSATAVREVLREPASPRCPGDSTRSAPSCHVPPWSQWPTRARSTSPRGASPRVAEDCSCSCLTWCAWESNRWPTPVPGSKMIPRAHAAQAVGHRAQEPRDGARRRRGVGLFCALNRIPKKSYLSEYSSRITPHTSALLGAWHSAVLGDPALFPAQSFDLDFHSVPYHGAHPYRAPLCLQAQPPPAQCARLSRPGRRCPRVLLRRCGPAQGRGVPSGVRLPRVLAAHPWGAAHASGLRSRLTTYAGLARLDAMGVSFITLRRRPKITEIRELPASAWRRIRLDVPARKYRTPRVWEKKVTLAGCRMRQLYILTSVCLTNDTRTPKTLITRYAQRMLERHLHGALLSYHALSSAVAMKVDFDMALLVMPAACIAASPNACADTPSVRHDKSSRPHRYARRCDDHRARDPGAIPPSRPLADHRRLRSTGRAGHRALVEWNVPSDADLTSHRGHGIVSRIPLRGNSG